MGDVGEVAKVFQPLSQLGADLLGRLLGPATSELGGWVGDHLKDRRARNVANTLELAAAMVNERGGDVRAAEPEFVLSTITAAARVADPDLRDLWARLLARAAESDDAESPALVAVVSSMSPEDARIVAHHMRTIGDNACSLEAGGNVVPTDAGARMQMLGIVELAALSHGAHVRLTGLGYTLGRVLFGDEFVRRVPARPAQPG